MGAVVRSAWVLAVLVAQHTATTTATPTVRTARKPASPRPGRSKAAGPRPRPRARAPTNAANLTRVMEHNGKIRAPLAVYLKFHKVTRSCRCS